MTKVSIFAFFMIIFVLGMVIQETQGQMCHALGMKSNCNDGACANLCKLKWKGSGSCFSNQHVYSCICNFPCKI
ncbi:hypothetical protein BRARA_G02426 [Brassica rapa]|uniref:Knottin scorpion toxin-like domain-containing protein n=2 Tax=Brassica TaxID=3705 RepID=A0A397YNY8_BRACM|nr:putative defensin-like protein 119 [Brassica napus]XP_048591821.1 putative defensin-like protein 119 [Brassica napus]RID55147.1 hypothetical protein BRARA_G02426 [Brassica rapa]CAF2184413.1 unnamed protein product [Brassica napus]CAG7903662.1 unnamed protein product [Brassica rapa]